MATQDDTPTKIAELPLPAFELPKWLVEPAVRSCRLFNTALGDVAPHHAGVAAGVLTSALQIGAAISVVAIGSLFFAVLGNDVGRDAYGRAFGIAQAATSTALLIAMLLSIPRGPSSRSRQLV